MMCYSHQIHFFLPCTYIGIDYEDDSVMEAEENTREAELQARFSIFFNFLFLLVN